MISHPSRLYMDDETILNKNRIEVLTDGVFAVVMTLLVLDISVPQISFHYAIDSVAAGTELLKMVCVYSGLSTSYQVHKYTF